MPVHFDTIADCAVWRATNPPQTLLVSATATTARSSRWWRTNPPAVYREPELGFLTASVASFFVKEQRSDEIDEVKATLNRMLQLLEASASTNGNVAPTDEAQHIEP